VVSRILATKENNALAVEEHHFAVRFIKDLEQKTWSQEHLNNLTEKAEQGMIGPYRIYRKST
jgi:hypothetical protein